MGLGVSWWSEAHVGSEREGLMRKNDKTITRENDDGWMIRCLDEWMIRLTVS